MSFSLAQAAYDYKEPDYDFDEDEIEYYIDENYDDLLAEFVADEEEIADLECETGLPEDYPYFHDQGGDRTFKELEAHFKHNSLIYHRLEQYMRRKAADKLASLNDY